MNTAVDCRFLACTAW